MSGGDTFSDKYQHFVWPAKDYLYATADYADDDPRKPLTDAYCSMVAERLGHQPYACRISLIKDWGYNVFLYLWDANGLNDVRTANRLKRGFTNLFSKALAAHPVAALADRELNPNGVIIEDFRTCSVSYTLSRAEPELEAMIADGYPQIVGHTTWDTFVYLFFSTMDDLRDFERSPESICFRQDVSRMCRCCDQDGCFDDGNPLSFILDLQQNFSGMKTRDYFNSDAMKGIARL